MNIWFTSDQHYYHENVIRYCNRPYKTVEEMNEDLVRRHNEVVKPGDTVYHLGDFSLSHRAVTVFLHRLNGEHHLIAGNHDHCHPLHYKKDTKGEQMRKLYHEAGFKSIKLTHSMEIAGQSVTMCHLPLSVDQYDRPRFKNYRPDTEGWLLCGHVHQHWKVRGKQINVGVDVWDYRPVHLKEIEKIISGEK